MKRTFFSWLLAFLVVGMTTTSAEARDQEVTVKEVMEAIGWSTEGLSFHELSSESPTVFIRRNGELVGYHTEERVWTKTIPKPVDLSGVTAIVFGQDAESIPENFRIEEPSEIAVWVTAYTEHTEFLERFSLFIPTSKNAGFERRRDEIEFGGAYLDNFGLRFYAGEKRVLELLGHLEMESTIIPGKTRNEVIHELIEAKFAELAIRVPGVDENDHQPGPGQPAADSELDPEGKDNSQPETDEPPR